MMNTHRVRALALVLCSTSIGACGDDAAGPSAGDGAEIAVVLNSVERSLTVFPVDSPAAARTIGLAPDGSPVSLAVRGASAVVPMGTLPAAVVVDLEAGTVRSVALPQGSGATGAAFLNDSIALVANPGLNSVSPINVLRGTRGASIAVGLYPQAIVAANDTAWVVNAHLDATFTATGPGTVSVLTGSPLAVVRTIQLSGINSGGAALGADGRIYVLNAGGFGAANGSLSAVDRRTLVEVAHDAGFGEFPGAVAVAPDGRVAVASFAYGIALWQPGTRAFLRAPADAIEPGGVASAAGLGFDGAGRLYALRPECVTAGSVIRLTAQLTHDRDVPTGICPFAIAFGRTEG